jgi:hypothetical protein
VPRGAESKSSRRALDRLAALRAQPAERAAFAVEVLATERGAEALAAALAALEQHPLPAAREPALALYRWIDEAPARRDPGGFTRTAVVRLLREAGGRADVPLFERAVQTFEPTPQDAAGPTALRAAALAALASFDPARAAAWAAVVLADERHTSFANGEPASTAARVLAVLEERAALLVYVGEGHGAHDEVLGTALRGLAGGPGEVIAASVEPLLGHRSEIVLLGLCDLFLEHAADGCLLSLLRRFLDSRLSPDIYRYAAASIVASRRPDLLVVLGEHAETQFDADRLGILAEALALSNQPEAGRVAALVNARLSPRR